MNRLIALLPLTAAMLMTQGCGQSQAQAAAATDAKDEAKVAVETARIGSGAWVRRLDTTATLEAEREAMIVAENGGELLRLLVEEGDRVVKGQVLAHLDGERARLMLKQQQSVANRLHHEASRQQMLLDRSMVSTDQADLARFNRDAQVAAVDLASVDVQRAVIRAPFSGTITVRHAKVGQNLKPNDAVFTIADFSELRADIAVPERELAGLRAGQPVKLMADAFPGQLFDGQVSRIAPVVDAATGTATATIDVHEAGTDLRPGQFTRLSIEREHLADAVIMPRAALLNAKDSAVFAVVDGKVKRVAVALGGEQDGLVRVVNGLTPGMEVVVMGQAQLVDGDAVEVINMPTDKEVLAAL